MSKLYNAPIEVKMSGNVPTDFIWRGRWRRIESIEKILVRRDYSDPHKHLDTYRAILEGGGVCDLVKVRGGWVLERVWD